MKNNLIMDGAEYRDLISRYHVKSEGWAIDAELERIPSGLTGSSLNKLLVENSRLLEICEPFLSTLYDYVQGTDFFLELIDKNGIILTIIGDDSVINQSKEIGMVVGTDMSISSAGTNAIAVALEEDCAIQMPGDDHYMNIFKSFTCSAAPVHDESGEIICCVNLNGNTSNMHKHTLGLVVAAVNSIENHFSVRSKQKELIKNFKYTTTIINSIDTGIIALGSDGKVILANGDSCRMFGRPMDKMYGMHIFELFDEERSFEDFVKEQKKMDSFEVRIKDTGFSVIVETRDIYEEDGSLSGMVLILRDIKKVIRLVDRYAGMMAKYTFDEFLGHSEAITKIVNYGRKISRSPSTVLITGENGTGKALFAQAIHNASQRRQYPFVAINCGAIPKELMESELFGYVEGAFAGGKKGGSTGKFSIADKGSLFIDEIDELPLYIQVSLLRALQESEITRVGAGTPVKVDVRIIAATDKDLKKEVKAGRFREDLFYRLNVIPIKIPNLRERGDDVRLLINHFLNSKAALLGKTPPKLSKELYDTLLNYSWPGNIRELENVIENIVNFDGRLISPLVEKAVHEKPIIQENSMIVPSDMTIAELERLAIIQNLEKSNYNYSETARKLGINRTTLYNKIKKYNIRTV